MSASQPSTRIALVDDRDERISYNGSWYPSPISTIFDSRGYLGPPFNSTLMQSDSVGASITFTFEGDSFMFYGSVESDNSSHMPRYSCTIDGVGLSWSSYPPATSLYVTNHYSFCWQHFLEDAHHTATFTIDDVDEHNNPILFDYVAYWPSPGANIGEATEHVWFNDPRVSFSSGWLPLGTMGNSRYATEEGASVTFTFEGQSVSLLGIVLNGSYTDGQGSYTLDNGAQITFTIPASISINEIYRNYAFFNITDLSEDPHTLVVTDTTSHSGQQPLIFSAFQARGHASDDPTVNHNGGGLSASAKAGIAVGAILGVVLIAVAIAVCFIYRHRQQRMQPSTPITPSSGAQLRTPRTADRPLSMTSAGANSPYGQPSSITLPMAMSSPNGASFSPSFHTVAAPPGSTGGPHGSANDARSTIPHNLDYQYLAANAYQHPPGIQDRW